MGFIANGVDVSGSKYVYVGKKRMVELACPTCQKVFQAKEEFSLADLINKCHDQRASECDACWGNGYINEGEDEGKDCPVCDGVGMVRYLR
jgi:hypothetical protein